MSSIDYSDKISEESREFAEEFATDYRKYVQAELKLDRRKVNDVIAKIANDLAGEIRAITGKITTTRYNEKIIRTIPTQRVPGELGSFEIEVDEVAYRSAHLPDDEMEAEIAGWILSRAEQIARKEVERQERWETNPQNTTAV